MMQLEVPRPGQHAIGCVDVKEVVGSTEVKWAGVKRVQTSGEA